MEGRIARAEQERSRAEQERARAEHERMRAEHERNEYKKLYELVSLELERTRRHLFGKKAETVDTTQAQLGLFQSTSPAMSSTQDGAAPSRSRGGTPKPEKAAPHG